MNILNGYKTYIGLIVTAIGLIGASDYITTDELTQLIDAIVLIIGSVITVIGLIHKVIKAYQAKQ
ncbi:hypothetical protein HGB07_05755 [Candidatus Roizmanbacteria bacterium]|nr:hypothetical protein [Candidatus Roizmanbacteria bacterium]